MDLVILSVGRVEAEEVIEERISCMIFARVKSCETSSEINENGEVTVAKIIDWGDG